jgi:DNA helicase-2/ATP-dependent DNA helicase PcrA
LLYVGMTRAKRRLFLTTCRRRRIAGRYQDQQESPFVTEIPPKYLEVEESPQVFASPPAAAFGHSRGDRGRAGDRRVGTSKAGSTRTDQPYLEGDVYRFFGNDSAKLPTPTPRSEPRAAGQTTLERPRPMAAPTAADPGTRASGRASGGSPTGSTVRKGTRVQHGKLGKGIVLGLEGEGENLRLTVLFERIGKRKLLARYANLEVI